MRRGCGGGAGGEMGLGALGKGTLGEAGPSRCAGPGGRWAGGGAAACPAGGGGR